MGRRRKRRRNGRDINEPLGEGVLSLDLPESAATVLLSCEEERCLRPTPDGVFLKEDDELCPRRRRVEEEERNLGKKQSA